MSTWKSLAVTAALTVSLAACGQRAEEAAAPTETPAGPTFQAVAENRLEAGDAVWVFDGPAEYATQDGKTLIRLQGPTGIVRVFETPVEAGKAYDLKVDVARTGGAAPTEVRAILSRDCATSAEEFSQQTAMLAPDQTASLTVAHTFKRNYPCAKMVLHTANATPADPAVIAITTATLTPKS
jgi:hypothetical protein